MFAYLDAFATANLLGRGGRTAQNEARRKCLGLSASVVAGRKYRVEFMATKQLTTLDPEGGVTERARLVGESGLDIGWRVKVHRAMHCGLADGDGGGDGFRMWKRMDRLL